MNLASAHLTAIEGFGGDPADFKNILEAATASGLLIKKAQRVLAGTTADIDGIAALVVGSLGRKEALEASDIDFAVLYDAERTTLDGAQDTRKEMVTLLENEGLNDVSSKTFKEPMCISDLLKDVGGEADTNRNLTYRSLVLTEAAWLLNFAEGKVLAERILGVYREGRSTRGRFLTSLSNDLHRYYRTLCVDYRYKIEETPKGWAIRNMKLRHSRKLWHLSNLSLQCAAVAKNTVDEHDGFLAQHLGTPPLLKLATALTETGGIGFCKKIWELYDLFLGWMRKKSFRDALDSVEYTERAKSSDFNEIQSNAKDFDGATRKVVEHLLQVQKSYVIRFGVL